MTSRTTFFCDACGDEMPVARLQPIFVMERASGAGDSLAEIFSGAQGGMWRPNKLGDVCSGCLEDITSGLHAAPHEIDGAQIDRILEGLR